MSRPKLLKLQDEVDYILLHFKDNSFLRAEAMLQLIHRENILVANRYREKLGLEPIIPDPVMYSEKGRVTHKKLYRNTEWVIDVPKEWVSETGRY